MNAITTTSNALMPHDMNGAMQLANMMATSKLVPAHLQRSPGDCLMVIEQAMRWGMSPFAVAQCTSVVQGKLMFEGKLVSAALHGSGIMATRLNHKFSGEGEARTICVYGTLVGETEPRDVTVALKDAKTNNGVWIKQPDQQLVYFATRAWARRHAPEAMLGVYSPEEFDAPTARPADPFTGTTLDAQAEPPARAVAAATPRPPRVTETTAPHPLDEPDGRKWLLNLDVMLANAQTQDEVIEIGGHHTVGKATAEAPDAIKRRISELLANAYARFPDDGASASEDLDEVQIAGAEKLAAGD